VGTSARRLKNFAAVVIQPAKINNTFSNGGLHRRNIFAGFHAASARTPRRPPPVAGALNSRLANRVGECPNQWQREYAQQRAQLLLLPLASGL